MAVEEYVVIVRGKRFVLARDQILFDSPNYFTILFDGPFKESSEGKREVVLYRDPYLFQFIESYLSGYQILPFPTTGLPHHMSHDAMVKNLFADAQFYQLDGLIKLLGPLVNAKYKLFKVFMGLYDSPWLFDPDSNHLRVYHQAQNCTVVYWGKWGEISTERAHSMVEYAKQSSSCTVLEGFYLDPHDKATCFEWVQRHPSSERLGYGSLPSKHESPVNRYDIHTYRIELIPE